VNVGRDSVPGEVGETGSATAQLVELGATARVASVPLAHLSIELGHLYMEDYSGGPQRLEQLFRQVARPAATAAAECVAALHPKTARVSTCFLVDDYFGHHDAPGEVVPLVVEAAAAAGLKIDYLVRESACAAVGAVDIGQLVAGRLVVDPPPLTTGGRPPSTMSGWLCNGERSPAQGGGQALRESTPWRPPSENGANRHSIFVDVQLWDEHEGRRRYSCAYLAAIWQLLRLGLLRDEGRPVVQPEPAPQPYPATWEALPPVVQLGADPAPFAAYRTHSVLATKFLPTEVAVRVILGQYAVETEVAAQATGRADAENLQLPASIVDRVGYSLICGAWR
jgi:hypothetical protein